MWNHRFVEHAGLSVFILAAGAVDEAVAQHVVVNAAVAALPIGRGAREPLHAIRGRWTFWKQNTFL